MTLRELLREPFTNTPYAKRVDLTDKRIIVTGCATGSIGYETAKTLARWGATVFITSRSGAAIVAHRMTAELQDDGVVATVVPQNMNLLSHDSVNQFADWYVHNHGERLDVLVNNAGVHLDLMFEWKEPKLTEDGFEIHWRINYMGLVQLTHGLLPLLQKTGQDQGESRVVNVVSRIHRKASNEDLFNPDAAYNSWRSYGLSKLGSIHFARELHRRYNAEYNLKAYALHPGSAAGTASDVANKGFEGHPIINFFRWLGSPIMSLIATNVTEGAQTQIYCTTSPEAPSGGYFQNCVLNETKATDDSRDESAAARLWQETQPWLVEVLASNDKFSA